MKKIKATFTQRTTAYNSDPHAHDGYELYFLLAGTREAYSSSQTLLLPPKTFYVFRPFKLHQLKGDSYTKIDICINESLLTNDERTFLDFVASGSPVSLDGENYSLYVDLLKKAVALQNSKNPNAEEYICALTKSILIFLQENATPTSFIPHSVLANPLADPLVVQLASYLDQNYASKITLQELSDKFFFSSVLLGKRFKKSMHCSIMDYLLRLRLNEAQFLLSSTDKSIEEISELCGFSSANYFGLIFKKHRQCSPMYYRKLKQKK